MIFGIKTRKELKKEIEDLKTALSMAHFDLPMSRVNVVFDNRPIDTVSAVVEISDYATSQDDRVLSMIQSKLSEDLRKYITVKSYHDPMRLAHRFVGTIKVIVPRKDDDECIQRL